MGLLDSVIGALTGGGRGGGDAALVSAVTDLLSKDSGGLGGLVQKFEQAGLGDTIKGWISTGPNPAISAEQLQAALGSDFVRNLAQRAGVNQNQLLSGLAGRLPALIDQLTPDGVAPSSDAMQNALGGLIGKMFRG